MPWLHPACRFLMTVRQGSSTMNRKLVAIAALAVAQLAGISLCSARNTPQQNPTQENAPQALTKSQAQAAGMIQVVLNFEKIDANGDGVVTRGELRAYVLANRRYVPMT
jgi:hypothetical protein